MISKLQHVSTELPSSNSNQFKAAEGHPSELPGLRDQIEKYLHASQPKKALDVLAQNKAYSAWSTNAVAVCLLRVGKADHAVQLLRNLVLSGSVLLRPDVPTAWKVNFATALLMTDNLFGCIQVLRDIRDEHHPGVQRLRGAIRCWHRELTMAEKFLWFLGGQPARRVELDFLPGEL